MSLELGTYAVLCFVSSGDRIPHLAKGIIRQLTVVLDDYTLALTPALPAGRRTVRVENPVRRSEELRRSRPVR